jgi:hypothetical protein
MDLQFTVDLRLANNIYYLDLPVNLLIERSTGELINVKACARIYQLGSSDTYTLLTSGGHKSSNRYHYNLTLDEAKFKAIKWAKNRYKVKA